MVGDYKSSLDLESMLVDQALDNVMTLPEALHEVMSMQKGQCDEIQKQEFFLQQLQVSYWKFRFSAPPYLIN